LLSLLALVVWEFVQALGHISGWVSASADSLFAIRRHQSSGGGKGIKRACPQAALCRGWHLEGQKYGIIKFGRFWRIGVCIPDSDIFTSLTRP